MTAEISTFDTTVENDRFLNGTLLRPDKSGVFSTYALLPKDYFEMDIEETLKIHCKNRIKMYDLETFFGSNYLNDVIISEYMDLIVKRNNNNPNLPTVYVLSLFVYTRYLSDKKMGKTFDIQPFIDRKLKLDPMETDLILFPINNGRDHWKMIIIDVKKHVICAFDSLGQDCSEELQAARDIMLELAKLFKHPFGFDEWFLAVENAAPRQKNSFNCGVYACITANYIADKRPLIFDETRMAYFRRRMKYEILQGKLMKN